jgi:hypothetical protein
MKDLKSYTWLEIQMPKSHLHLILSVAWFCAQGLMRDFRPYAANELPHALAYI